MRLLEQYKEMHRQGHFAGHSLRQHVPDINALLEKHKYWGGTLVLDYGCGGAKEYQDHIGPFSIPDEYLYGKWKKYPVYYGLYDPCAEAYAKKPEGRFHGVICTDVLEHIPEDELQDVLKDIYSYAEKFVFFSVCTRPAKKCLPDGQNCHVTVKPEDWWLTTIHSQAPIGLDIQVVFT